MYNDTRLALGLGLPRPNFQQGSWGMVGRMGIVTSSLLEIRRGSVAIAYAFAKGGNLHLMHPTSSNTKKV